MTIAGRYDLKSAMLIALYLSAAAGSLILAITAFRWSLADVYATQVSHHLNAVDRSSSNKNAAQWRQAKEYLDRSLALRPSYGSYFELAEGFYQKLEALESHKSPLINELGWCDNAEKALDNARSGLHIMPSNVFLWGRMISSKLKRLQFDNELTGVFERAVSLGPWVRSVQYRVALAGVGVWPFLPVDAHPHILQAIEQTLAMAQIQADRRYDIKRILSHTHFAQVCDEMKSAQPHLLKYCL